jgi:tripartite-type tricarboxylate transporter receptor subunit TctC
MIRSLALFGAAVAIAQAGPAAAEYPEQPITFIVPFSPGGSTDIGVRTVARYLEACLGGTQPIAVVNRPGAGGQIGFTELANSPPDGYTLSAMNVPNVQIGTITKADPNYTMDSFDYLGSLYATRTTIAIQPESEIESVQELIDRGKEAGEPVKIGISGPGSDDHMLLLKLEKNFGADFEPIPFGDSAGAQTALLGGHTEIAVLSVPAAAQHGEKVRVLGVAAERPVDALPGVPTFRDQGLDIINGTTHVIGVPKGIPEEAFNKLTGCLKTIAADPALVQEINKFSFIFNPMDSEETTKFMYDEAAMLEEIWKTSPWE